MSTFIKEIKEEVIRQYQMTAHLSNHSYFIKEIRGFMLNLEMISSISCLSTILILEKST